MIRFKATDKGVKDVGIDHLNIAILTTTDINAHNIDATHVVIYPNPNNGNFNIKTNDATKHIHAEVYDQLGQLVLLKEGAVGEANIQVNDLNEGVYFVRVYADGIKLTTQKLMVDKTN